MLLRNTQDRYGAVAVLLHWLMALLIIALLVVGLYMVRIAFSAQKLALYGWHKEYGILVLFLVLLRIVWRITNRTPSLPLTVPLWQQLAAHAAHYAFYGFMIVIPLSGWFISSAAGLPVSFFGLFVLPDVVPVSKNLYVLFIAAHEWLSYALIAVICVHVAAALKHHFIDKDDVLRKIL